MGMSSSWKKECVAKVKESKKNEASDNVKRSKTLRCVSDGKSENEDGVWVVL